MLLAHAAAAAPMVLLVLAAAAALTRLLVLAAVAVPTVSLALAGAAAPTVSVVLAAAVSVRTLVSCPLVCELGLAAIAAAGAVTTRRPGLVVALVDALAADGLRSRTIVRLGVALARVSLASWCPTLRPASWSPGPGWPAMCP